LRRFREEALFLDKKSALQGHAQRAGVIPRRSLVLFKDRMVSNCLLSVESGTGVNVGAAEGKL